MQLLFDASVYPHCSDDGRSRMREHYTKIEGREIAQKRTDSSLELAKFLGGANG